MKADGTIIPLKPCSLNINNTKPNYRSHTPLTPDSTLDLSINANTNTYQYLICQITCCYKPTYCEISAPFLVLTPNNSKPNRIEANPIRTPVKNRDISHDP